jgi:hypothetical protein
LVSLDFVETKLDTSLSVYLLLYMDDIVLTASSLKLLQCTTTALQQEFTIKDLGPGAKVASALAGVS